VRRRIASTAANDGVAGHDQEPSKHSALEQGVPRSMAEIYKLSNLSRHRNKDKKRLKELVSSAQQTPASPVQFGDEPGSSGSQPVSGGKAKPGERLQTDEFMRDIGWLDGGADGDDDNDDNDDDDDDGAYDVDGEAVQEPEQAGQADSNASRHQRATATSGDQVATTTKRKYAKRGQEAAGGQEQQTPTEGKDSSKRAQHSRRQSKQQEQEQEQQGGEVFTPFDYSAAGKTAGPQFAAHTSGAAGKSNSSRGRGARRSSGSSTRGSARGGRSKQQAGKSMSFRSGAGSGGRSGGSGARGGSWAQFS